MNEILQQAKAFIKAGQKKKGGQILAQIVKQQPDNEEAWFLLARCVSSKQQKTYCLDKVLKINPQNINATDALQKLQQKQTFQFEDNLPSTSRTNGNAMTSLITGIVGWLFGISTIFAWFLVSYSNQFLISVVMFLAMLFWVISIATGFTGLKQIKKDSMQKGDGIARAGTTMSIVGIIFPIFFFCLLLMV